MLIRRTPYPGASAVKLGYKREDKIDNKKVIGRPCLETSVGDTCYILATIIATIKPLKHREEIELDKPTGSTTLRPKNYVYVHMNVRFVMKSKGKDAQCPSPSLCDTVVHVASPT